MNSTPVDYSIDIQNLRKVFRRSKLGKKTSYSTLKTSALSFFKRKPAKAYLQTVAIDDLTMRVPRGASMGIIGRNGSGKSTLLKLISGIYTPSKGTVSVNGRIAALIELGAGFHPDFSGRENLYLGGAMHGLSKKIIDQRFQKIVDFAELEDVIDEPVRTYSSGMYMRLGFSLAIHTDPDILIVDEVLSVGDASFVNKCKERISEIKKEGKTLLLVSHDLHAVRLWCDEAVWLDKGVVQDRGDPARVIDAYREFVEKGEERELSFQDASTTNGTSSYVSDLNEGKAVAEKKRWGSREVEILGARLLGANGEEKFVYHPEEKATVEISYKVNQPIGGVVFGVGINRSDGLSVFGTNTHLEDIKVPELHNEGKLQFIIERIGLLDGRYTLDIAVHSSDEYPYDYRRGLLEFAVRCAVPYVGVSLPEHSWRFF